MENRWPEVGDFYKGTLFVEPIQLFISEVGDSEKKPNGQTYHYEIISQEILEQKMKSDMR